MALNRNLKAGAAERPAGENVPTDGPPPNGASPTSWGRRARRPAARWSAWPTWATLVGWPLLFLGRRVLDAEEVLSRIVTPLAAGLLVLGFAAAVFTVKRSPVDRRPATRVLAALSGLSLLALSGYAVTTAWGRALLGVEAPAMGKPDPFGEVTTVAWIVLVAVSYLGTVLGEIARLSMQRAERVESRRVVAAVAAGATVALAISYGALFTFGAGRIEWSADFSYFRTARPSESTRAMIESLDGPLEVLLFFPQLNEVGREVEQYLRELGRGSDKLVVASHDRLLVPDVAKENNVRKDGVVVLVREKKRETLELGVEMQKVSRKLKNLDGEFQKVLLKALRGKRTAYLTVGHGELNETTEDREGRTTKLLRANLESQHYDVRDLGLAQGLGSEIPKDATVVMVLGPKQPFLAEEIAALEAYAERGGHLLLALDPEAKVDLQPLAAVAGVTWQPALIVNDKVMLRRRHNDSDKSILVAKRFSSHASVSTLSKLAARGAAVLLPGAAPLDKLEGADSALKVDFAVRSVPQSYLDLDGNFTFDKETEKQSTFNLVAAVSRPPEGDEKDAAPKGEADSPTGPPEMRAFVVGDVDCLSDVVLEFSQTNLLMFLEAVRWLGGEESFSGEITSEEDVEIVHTKSEDQVWFYATIIAAPAVVLGAGLFNTRKSRRKKPTGGATSPANGGGTGPGRAAGERSATKKGSAKASDAKPAKVSDSAGGAP